MVEEGLLRAVGRTPLFGALLFRNYALLKYRYYRLQERFLGGTKPHVVQWLTTYRCNFRCLHCEASAGAARSAEVPGDVLRRAIDDMARLGTRRLLATGGEPLLRRDVFEVLSYARARGIGVALLTNGSLVDRRREEIREAGLSAAMVSVDDHGARHDALRGFAGSYESALGAVRTFRALGVPSVSVFTVAYPGNLPHLGKVLEEIARAGATSWRISLPIPVGRAAGKDEFRLSDEEIRRVFAFVEEERRRFDVSLAESAGYLGAWDRRLRDRPFFPADGFTRCAIMPDGEVLASPAPYDNRYSVGNIGRRPFRRIWREGFRDLRKIRLPEACELCEHWPACLGGNWGMRVNGAHCSRRAWDPDPGGEAGRPRRAPLARLRKRVLGIVERAASFLRDRRRAALRAEPHVESPVAGREALRAVYLRAGEAPSIEAILDAGRFARGEAAAVSRRGARRAMAGADLAVVRGPAAVVGGLTSGADLLVPEWVDQRVDLSGTLADVEARFRRNTRSTDLRLVRKYGYTYRIVRSPSALRAFYDGMYRPYAEERFGPRAVRLPLEQVRLYFDMGELLVVGAGGAPVAGAVTYERGSTYFLRLFGVHGADGAARRRGGLSAVYYFAIREAHRRGLRWIDLRLSLPCLTDGVFRHKRKWGAEVRPCPDVGCARVRFGNLGPAVQALLAERPLIVRTEDGLAAVGSAAPAGGPIGAEALRALRLRYETPGLARVLWLAPAGLAPDGAEALASGEGGTIALVRPEDVRPADLPALLRGPSSPAGGEAEPPGRLYGGPPGPRPSSPIASVV